MKKLFISCPMRGRTQEAIARSKEDMHKLAEIYFGEPLEVIPSTLACKPPENTSERIWYLGESIKRMADADYFIGIQYEEFFAGCMTETDIARRYRIPNISIRLYELQSLKDCLDIIRDHYDNFEKTNTF